MNGRKTAAFWYDVDLTRPASELALEHGVTVDAIYYHKRRIKRVGSMSEAKRGAVRNFAAELLQSIWAPTSIKSRKATKSDIRYAILFEAKEALNSNGAVHTSEGELFWVTRNQRDDEWYVIGNTGTIPKAAKTFASPSKAELFMKKWDGYPWYAQPLRWRIIPVRPNMITIQSGWEFLSNNP